jgi:hypothetical protein
MRASISAAAVAAALGLGLALGATEAANAAVYDFSGLCRDCMSVGTGTLTLNNAPTGPLSTSDFVSFVYTSNLVSFSLDSSDIVAMLGSFDPSRPDATVIDIIQLGGTGWEFERNADGSWSVSSEIGASKRGSGGGGGGGGGGSFGGGGGGSPGFSGGGSDSSGGSEASRVIDDFGPTSSFQQAAEALVVSVPEPGAWALMILGFAGTGTALRARRRVTPQPSPTE